MARPREFDETKVKEALMLAFWEKGFEATSMRDLVEATGLLKGSLYGAFGDKKAMYLTALAYYDETRIQAAVDMLNTEGQAKQKIARLFNSIIEARLKGQFSGGCLLCNASIEMVSAEPDVESSVVSTISRLQTAIVLALAGVANAKSVASFIISAYFGCRVLAKANVPEQMIEQTRDLCIKDL